MEKLEKQKEWERKEHLKSLLPKRKKPTPINESFNPEQKRRLMELAGLLEESSHGNLSKRTLCEEITGMKPEAGGTFEMAENLVQMLFPENDILLNWLGASLPKNIEPGKGWVTLDVYETKAALSPDDRVVVRALDEDTLEFVYATADIDGKRKQWPDTLEDVKRTYNVIGTTPANHQDYAKLEITTS